MTAAPLRPGEMVRIRGQRWSVTSPAGTILHVRGCEAANRHAVTAFLAAVERIERLPPPAVRVVTRRRWRRDVRAILADAAAPDSLIAAAAARIDILPYQLEPAIAVVRGVGVRLLIADEVGLGKTIEAGLIVAETLARSSGARILIVVPVGLREQWQLELLQRFGVAAARLDSTTIGDSTTASLAGGNPWIAAAVGITSVDFIKRPEVIRSLEPLVWDLVIFDEAHALTGRSDRAAAARVIAERARTVVMLTATPHNGDDEAFERLTNVGDIERRFPLVVFRRNRHDAGLTGSRRTTWLRVRPAAAEQAMHAALTRYASTVWRERGATEPAARLAMIVLTRRACSSPSSLVRSLERRMLLLGGLDVEQAQLQLPLGGDELDEGVLAAPGMSDGAREGHMLAELLELAVAASLRESKPALLLRLLRRARQPAIVFTEYRDTLGMLVTGLAEFSPAVLHGGLTSSERRDAVAAFTRGGAELLLATDAASEGLNLHERCRLVVNLELPWTPLRLEQRIGRIERIGQQRRVHAVHLVAAGASEEAIVERLARRQRRVEQAIDELRLPISEHEIAAAVFGGAEISSAIEQPHIAARDLIVSDLRGAAAAEAARITRARMFAHHVRNVKSERQQPTHVPARPVVTHGRRSRVPFAACCLYRFIIGDADDEYISEWLLAVAVHRPSWPRHDDLRRRLTAVEDLIDWRVRDQYQPIRSAFLSHRESIVRAALDRERAILATLTGAESRLALRLLQPGLFDRRPERAAAAREAIVREAAERCHQRLSVLRRLAAPAVLSHSLVCAILAD